MPPKRARGAKLEPMPSEAELEAEERMPPAKLDELLERNAAHYATFAKRDTDTDTYVAIDRCGHVLRTVPTLESVTEQRGAKAHYHVPVEPPSLRSMRLVATASERFSLRLGGKRHAVGVRQPSLIVENTTVARELKGYLVVARNCRFEAPLVDCDVIANNGSTFAWLEHCEATLSCCEVKSAIACHLDGHDTRVRLAVECSVGGREMRVDVAHLVRNDGDDNHFGLLLPYGKTV